MSVMDLFKGKKKQEVRPTAIEYVEWLLRYMLRTSRTEMSIDTARPLPGQGDVATDDPPPCLPDVMNVVNRLKILSGLSTVPFHREGESEGSFERLQTHHTAIYTTRFVSHGDKSVCHIRLRVRCQNGVTREDLLKEKAPHQQVFNTAHAESR